MITAYLILGAIGTLASVVSIVMLFTSERRRVRSRYAEGVDLILKWSDGTEIKAGRIHQPVTKEKVHESRDEILRLVRDALAGDSSVVSTEPPEAETEDPPGNNSQT